MDSQVTRTTLAIDGVTYSRLVNLARQNERSASAEARLAIRRHLDTNAPAAPRAADKPDRGAAVGVGGAAA